MFYIPNEVVVGGMTYDVELEDRIRDSQGPVGRCSPMDGMIELNEADSDDFIYQTFIHELVHCLHYQMGYSGDSIIEDEHYVDGFANAWYALLKNNPHIFDYEDEDDEDECDCDECTECADKEEIEMKTNIVAPHKAYLNVKKPVERKIRRYVRAKTNK